MSFFDLFLLLCILIVSSYTYTKRNVMIIETYSGRNNNDNSTEKRLKALESIVKSHTHAISVVQNTVKYLTTVIGFKETENKKSLFERILVIEEETSGEGDVDDGFEYQLPDS